MRDSCSNYWNNIWTWFRTHWIFCCLCKLYLVHFNIHISYPTASKKSIFALHGLLWVVALLTFTLNEVIVDEAGGHAKPTYGLGLYLWFTAFLLTTIAEFLKQRIYQNLKENTKRIK